ncbi:hypothetical protein Hanom_Chr12g01149741 [Helianthus anomalus]
MTRVGTWSNRRDYISRCPYNYKWLLKVQLRTTIEGAAANWVNAFGIVLLSSCMKKSLIGS